MPDQKSQTLEALIKLLDNNLSPDEFLAAFEKVMQRQVQHENWTKAEVDKILASLSQFYDQLRQSHANLTEAHKSSLNASQEQFLSAMESKVRGRLAELKDGKPGKDGKDGMAGRDGSPDTPEIVRSKLLLAEKLPLSAIDGLEARLKALGTPPSGLVMTPRYVHVPMMDDFSTKTDGLTKVFHLSKGPRTLTTIKAWGSDFPYILTNNNGFTVAGKTLTLSPQVPAPSNGATFVVEYYI